MRCFVGFFGLTRSVRQTVESIRTGFYEPLAAAGITTLRAGHFNLPDSIDNPRSGEATIVPDRNEGALLDLELSWVEPQRHDTISREWEIGRCFPDAFGDHYRSLANLCHQLRSLDRLWSLLELLGVQPDDAVLLLRPDLVYLDTLGIENHLLPLLAGQADMVVPAWQSWGGLNDRFAFCTGYAAKVYATRISRLEAGCMAIGMMHAERFLNWVVQQQGLSVLQTDFRAARLRANGTIAANDMPMTRAYLQDAVLAAARAASEPDACASPSRQINRC